MSNKTIRILDTISKLAGNLIAFLLLNAIFYGLIFLLSILVFYWPVQWFLNSQYLWLFLTTPVCILYLVSLIRVVIIFYTDSDGPTDEVMDNIKKNIGDIIEELN